jgi:hypothetical protein
MRISWKLWTAADILVASLSDTQVALTHRAVMQSLVKILAWECSAKVTVEGILHAGGRRPFGDG